MARMSCLVVYPSVRVSHGFFRRLGLADSNLCAQPVPINRLTPMTKQALNIGKLISPDSSRRVHEGARRSQPVPAIYLKNKFRDSFGQHEPRRLSHQTGDPVRLIPCMGVLEADEGKFLFKLFRYSSANNFF